MKHCKGCGTDKPEGEFRRGRPKCRDCENAACRAYGKANRARRNERLRRWRRSNPDAARANDKRKHLMRNYRLTEEDVERMRADQKGLCALCGEARPLVIDHCHETGRVRGLICTPCNNGLGWIEGQSVSQRQIAAYLADPCHADVLLELANDQA